MTTGPYILRGLLGIILIVGAGVLLGEWLDTGNGEPSDGTEAELSRLAVLSGVQHSNSSDVFTGGEAVAVMGGIELDLRGAQIAGDEARLELVAVMGGISMRIPESWILVNDITPVLGGIEDRTSRPADATKRLIVKGAAVMGGIEISN